MTKRQKQLDDFQSGIETVLAPRRAREVARAEQSKLNAYKTHLNSCQSLADILEDICRYKKAKPEKAILHSTFDHNDEDDGGKLSTVHDEDNQRAKANAKKWGFLI